MGRRYRNGHWTIDYYSDGRNGPRIYYSVPRSIQDEDIVKKLEEDLIGASKGLKGKPRADTTINDLCPLYLDWFSRHRGSGTYKDVEGIFRLHFSRIIGHTRIVQIDNHTYESYAKTRGKELRITTAKDPAKAKKIPITNRSINKELAYLSGFVTWARGEEKYVIPEITWEKLPEEGKLPNPLSLEDTFALIEAAEGVTKPILMLLYFDGLRSREARELRIEDVNFDNMILRVKQKGNTWKTEPIPEIAVPYIEEAIGDRKSGYVFLSRTGGPVRDLRTRIRDAKEKAGIKRPIKPHDLRHSCATHLTIAGVNQRTIQKMMGHSDIKTTVKYQKLIVDDTRKANTALQDAYRNVASNKDSKKKRSTLKPQTGARSR